MVPCRLWMACTVAVLGILAGSERADAQPESPARPSEPGPAERLGSRFDEALREVQDQFRGLSAEVQRRVAEARSEVHAMSISARVYARLHWDQALEDATIAVDVHDDGTAVLTGTVASTAARNRASDLARTTVGVTGVENNLELTPPGDDVRAEPPGNP